MAKITIIFQEEGQDPVTMEVPETAAAFLDRFVAETTHSDATGNLVPKYAGKADLFYKHNLETLLKPIAQKYQFDATHIQELEDQKKALEDQINNLKDEAIKPVIIIP